MFYIENKYMSLILVGTFLLGFVIGLISSAFMISSSIVEHINAIEGVVINVDLDEEKLVEAAQPYIEEERERDRQAYQEYGHPFPGSGGWND